MDLSNLLSTVAPVDFVKFDPRNETIAYVCFQQQYTENNNLAIQRFDGKKAMGNTLTVENATSLADRIAPAQNRSRREFDRPEAPRSREQPRVRAKAKAKVERAKKIRPVKKTAEDLDNELSAYMNAASGNSNDNGTSETAMQDVSQPIQQDASQQGGVEASAPFAAQNNGEAMMD